MVQTTPLFPTCPALNLRNQHSETKMPQTWTQPFTCGWTVATRGHLRNHKREICLTCVLVLCGHFGLVSAHSHDQLMQQEKLWPVLKEQEPPPPSARTSALKNERHFILFPPRVKPIGNGSHRRGATRAPNRCSGGEADEWVSSREDTRLFRRPKTSKTTENTHV